MEENSESTAAKEKLDKAFKKLWTLEQLDQRKLRSSNYNFGVEKPFVNDRCTFIIKVGSSHLKCQIIFDSNDYNFPPDILFHQLPDDVSDMSMLLPNEEWDLSNEECLYAWIQRVLKLIAKEPPQVVEKDIKNEKPIKKGYLSDDDFEDSLLHTKKEDEEHKPKKTFPIFKDKNNEVNTSKEVKKKEGDETDWKSSFFDDEKDDVDIFDIFKTDEKEKKKTRERSISDIEFVDDDYHKYTSSCDVLDTTVNDKGDMDVESTKSREQSPDIEIISSSRDNSKEKKKETQRPFENKHIGASLASIKNKLKSSNIDMDDSIFDFPTSTPSKKPSSPKRQSLLKSPQRSSTVGKRPSEVVDLVLDDNDDFEDPLPQPPSKSRKTEHQSKLFNLHVQKSPRRSEQLESKITNTGSQMKSKEEFRKKFMTAWLHRYKNNILVYDTERFEHFSLYLTFGLSASSEVWTRFRNQWNPLDEKLMVCKPKLQAPVVVHFKMDGHFPKSTLKIKVISVLNTTSGGSEEPEVMDLQYEVNERDTISNSIEHIMGVLKVKVPPFHCQVKDIFF